MKTNKPTLFFILIFLISSFPALADGQGGIPAVAVAMIYLLGILSALATAFGIAFIFKKIYEKTREEERASVIWMTLCTLILPLTYTAIEIRFNLLYPIEKAHGYEIRNLVNILNYAAMIFAGFNAGYFMTVKKQGIVSRERTPQEKKRVILIQSIAWIILLSIISYFGLRPQLEARGKTQELEEHAQKRKEKSLSILKRGLDSDFTNVQWQQTTKRFLAKTKDGIAINAIYDSTSNSYSLKFFVESIPSVNDTSSWTGYLTYLQPFLLAHRYQRLQIVIDEGQFQISESDKENPYYSIPFWNGNLVIAGHVKKKQMEIFWGGEP